MCWIGNMLDTDEMFIRLCKKFAFLVDWRKAVYLESKGLKYKEYKCDYLVEVCNRTSVDKYMLMPVYLIIQEINHALQYNKNHNGVAW